MADFERVKPGALVPGDVVILAELDDDFMVQDYEIAVSHVEHVRPTRYLVTYANGESQYVSAREQFRVRR